MFSNNGNSEIGQVKIITTDYRGMSPDELSELCVEKIIRIGHQSHPAIQAQAVAFREQIRKVVAYYIALAKGHEHSDIYGNLVKHGQADTAELLVKQVF